MDDAIGVCGWPLEIHRPGTVAWEFIPGRGYSGVRYRTLLPQNVENLLVAGRCPSATPEAQASARVSGPCFVMGQAAGTAATLAASAGGRPAAVAVPAWQESLSRQVASFGEGPSGQAGTTPAASAGAR